MSWARPQEVVVLAGAAVMLAASGLLLVARRPAPPIRIIDVPKDAPLVIQVDGAVARPGVYRLSQGARVGDAVAAAGGLRPEADDSALNRARLLRDGDRVAVPPRAMPDDSLDEAGGAPAGNDEGQAVWEGRDASDRPRAGSARDASRARDAPRARPVRTARDISKAGRKHTPIDLNRATPAELEALPGIGPVLARRIVEYRSARGPLRRVEDLLEVNGVGPRLLERLRPHVVIR